MKTKSLLGKNQFKSREVTTSVCSTGRRPQEKTEKMLMASYLLSSKPTLLPQFLRQHSHRFCFTWAVTRGEFLPLPPPHNPIKAWREWKMGRKLRNFLLSLPRTGTHSPRLQAENKFPENYEILPLVRDWGGRGGEQRRKEGGRKILSPGYNNMAEPVSRAEIGFTNTTNLRNKIVVSSYIPPI